MKAISKYKYLPICCFLIVVISIFSSCSDGRDESDLLSEIREKGEITIAMEGTWAPWTYHDENGELTGYDVEVGKKIAEKLGVKAVFIEGEWDGLLAGLDAGRYDIVINGVDVTEEREEKYSFSEPYAYIKTALIVPEECDDIAGFEDLQGKTTANSINSTYMQLGEKYGADVEGVDSLSETMEMVLSGRADATINAEVSFYDYMKEHPEAPLKIAALTEESNHVAIPIRKDASCSTLLEEINNAISELRDEGELAGLSEKFFGADLSEE